MPAIWVVWLGQMQNVPREQLLGTFPFRKTLKPCFAYLAQAHLQRQHTRVFRWVARCTARELSVVGSQTWTLLVKAIK